VIKLRVDETTLAFVSCHLAAHARKLKDRNANCVEILRETRKYVGVPHLDASSEFDHVIWMGDLNYRVDLPVDDDDFASPVGARPPPSGGGESPGSFLATSMSRRGEAADKMRAEKARKEREKRKVQAQTALVRRLVEQGDMQPLFDADQLRKCQAAAEIFVGYKEGNMDFAPTFKVLRKPGTLYIDKRVPSYCDRILWKSMPSLEKRLRQMSLRALPEVSTSDHKPVVATFDLTPTPPIERISRSVPTSICRAPLVRLTNVTAEGLIDADTGGGSDPYMLFYTSPADLMLASVTPASSHKKVPARRADGRAHSTSWESSQVPLLRVRVKEPMALQLMTLVIVIMDRDKLGSDDVMGYVQIPLSHPSGAAALRSESEFSRHFDEPVVRHNCAHDMGRLCGEVTISFGESLQPALNRAKLEGASSMDIIGRKAHRRLGGQCSCSLM